MRRFRLGFFFYSCLCNIRRRRFTKLSADLLERTELELEININA